MPMVSGVFAGLVVIGMILAGCGENGAEESLDQSEDGLSEGDSSPPTGPGGIQLIEGYEHVFTGDSARNSGRISKSPTPTIVYSIGSGTGNFVHELATDQGLTPETREEGDRTFQIVRNNGLLFITVTKENAPEDSKDYPANFQAPVSDDEVDEVIDMVMTYNP